MNDEIVTLASKRCRPCEGDLPPLATERVLALLPQLQPGWHLSEDGRRIERQMRFRNYYQTSAFINAVIWIAHQEDHHPDISFGYNEAHIAYTTHAIGGLSENDFICAAKVDALLGP
ncbi:4a-hydroxytetrahydrobiopterin dehydratase [Candidatus Macondimonas diazotrophica]|jgi:4a-hydroxytetrahydrobiopterin dehydratase|uniref:Putative pterin-4-alpha-carbinolamine dehydratase n=1 Tax=Candidatus Macondimonas diazotrophica TaxID=2305248 RepID=A0A4Z0FBK3_9GAMM|nr:4a-hydroxytetrahydrobiopterin dehydratase [Pseudomonadota bacterium]NCU00088.1 4a-hydroxytetrahydrobiopterin dehydratase [Candidatus Macondimonas diazotrophica]TFZ83873.1 4a-hydroxytetrahydrobiopterin dehydratase [Candidatus Macondimonas diazotrophica]HBG31676.1 4a-hydroxytetrahydrobiopterin dehydratase [Gammaproteobacteria bacterium]HBG51994.1 4a-hydroxytetrahydrobiopterin dehydratase [Gammaproteobacteria bacterium]